MSRLAADDFDRVYVVRYRLISQREGLIKAIEDFYGGESPNAQEEAVRHLTEMIEEEHRRERSDVGVLTELLTNSKEYVAAFADAYQAQWSLLEQHFDYADLKQEEWSKKVYSREDT